METENKEKKAKIRISQEQIERACETMGKTANAVDTIYGNIKESMGPLGKAIGFGILLTLVLALVHSPGLLFVLIIAISIGYAPVIYKKILELRATAEANKLKREELQNAKKSEEKETLEKK